MSKQDLLKVKKCYTKISYFSVKFNQICGAIVKDISEDNRKLYVVNSGECIWIDSSNSKLNEL